MKALDESVVLVGSAPKVRTFLTMFFAATVPVTATLTLLVMVLAVVTPSSRCDGDVRDVAVAALGIKPVV
jgi:hypothetical protein